MLNKLYTYHLQPYAGPSTRHRCPQCERPHEFTLYVDQDGNPVHETVGICNRSSKCGYKYTPKQYFLDHGAPDKAQRIYTPKTTLLPDKPKPNYIPFTYVQQSLSLASNFVTFLFSIFPEDIVLRVAHDYWLGATKAGEIIYWQVDEHGQPRTGKIMQYDARTGHRIRDQCGVNWVHSKLIRRHELPTGFHMVQCLFGTHLLNRSGNEDKLVVLVEAEKTAIIGCCMYPEYVWLATGGKQQLSTEKLRVLIGRKVLAFPDADGYDEWRKKIDLCNHLGTSITISDYLVRNADSQFVDSHADIADLLISQLQIEPVHAQLAEVHEPNTEYL